MADKPTTVTVEALQAHTAFGKAYDVGDTYDIDEQYVVDGVVSGGMAVRVDRVKVAKAAKAAQKDATKKGRPVEPMKADRVATPVRAVKPAKAAKPAKRAK